MVEATEKFLVDSNSFMTPFRFYYAFDLIPSYWKELSNPLISKYLVVLDMVKDCLLYTSPPAFSEESASCTVLPSVVSCLLSTAGSELAASPVPEPGIHPDKIPPSIPAVSTNANNFLYFITSVSYTHLQFPSLPADMGLAG